jgi:hypothetical protein
MGVAVEPAGHVAGGYHVCVPGVSRRRARALDARRPCDAAPAAPGLARPVPATPAAIAGVAWIAAAVAWTVAALVGAAARAQPLVRVRAESRIELTAHVQDGRLEVVAVLRDDLGQPLAGRELWLSASDAVDGQGRPRGRSERRRVTTDAEGAARLSTAASAGPVRVGAAFLGDADHEKVEVERQVAAGRADLRLRVGVPDGGRLRLDREAHTVEVVADSPAGGAGLEVELLDELGRSLGRAVTDEAGRVVFRVLSEQLGSPAAGRVVARSAGDATRAEAQTEVPVVRVAPTALALTVDADEAVTGEIVAVAGSIRDHRGRPLGRAAIGLYADEAHVATVLAGDDGTFAANLVLHDASPGVALQARYDADAPWRESARSASRTVRVRRVMSRATIALGLALTATLAGLGALGLRRRGAGASPARTAPARAAGVTVAAARQRAAERYDLGGVVLDARGEGPIAGAKVTLCDTGGAVVARAVADADGRFALDARAAGSDAPGERLLRGDAEGYADARHPLLVPHRGEWSEVRVHLESLRDVALDAVAVVAREVMPDAGWGVPTPRETAHASARRGPVPLAEATAALAAHAERAGFARTPPSPADIALVEQARDAALSAAAARPHGDRPRGETAPDVVRRRNT